MNQTKAVRQDPHPSTLIFVVDDNAVLVQFAETVLEGAGYEVRPFTSPKECLKAMQSAEPKPAALVTDYEMEGMNGLDLIESSYKINPSIKTVLLSGSIDGSFVSKHPAKVHKFLGKPYLPAQLKTMVGELLHP
jgi:CheY-like chemotaxis protein